MKYVITEGKIGFYSGWGLSHTIEDAYFFKTEKEAIRMKKHLQKSLVGWDHLFVKAIKTNKK